MNEILKTIENPIAEFKIYDEQLNKFLEQYKGVVYDLTDPTQEKIAKSDRLSLGKAISALDSKHKELKAPLKERTDLIDGERKRIKDGLLDVQGMIKSQIEAHEQVIQDKVEKLQSMVEDIRELAVFVYDETDSTFIPTARDVEQRLVVLHDINVDESYEDRQADATFAQVQTVKELESMLAERQKHESEQAELEQLRKEAEDRERKDGEDRIAREAAEKATKAAEEKAEQERQKEANKAQVEIEEAHRREMKAEQAVVRVEQEKKEVAERAAKNERERIDKEQQETAEKKRQSDEALMKKKDKQEYRAKIHKAAKESFISNGFNNEEAEQIVQLVKDGHIDNVTIIY